MVLLDEREISELDEDVVRFKVFTGLVSSSTQLGWLLENKYLCE